MSKPKLSAEEIRQLEAQTEAEAFDTVNPVHTTPPSGSEHRESVQAEDPEEIQYQLDPMLVQQATQNKNARLIAMMVNENAMLEVALEQERRTSAELQAKMVAMRQAFGVDES